MGRRTSKYAKAECSSDEFERSIGVQIGNGTSFRVEIVGKRSKLMVYERMIKTHVKKSGFDLGGLSNEKFSAFIGRFNKHLYKRFRTIESLWGINISWEGGAGGSIPDNWKKMKKGDFFYSIDLKSAFWQLGYKLGYVDQDFFDQFIQDDLYKVAKRLCYSWLARKRKAIYYTPSGIVEIKGEIGVIKKVFDNVRYELYNKIKDARSGLETVIEWNIDAISVLGSELDIVKERFDKMGLVYKVTLCRKLNETEYQHGSKIKNY